MWRFGWLAGAGLLLAGCGDETAAQAVDAASDSADVAADTADASLDAPTPEDLQGTDSEDVVEDPGPVAPVAEVWLTGLVRPWDIAFLPDGTALVTERGGRLLAVDPESQERRVLLDGPDDLVVSGQSGMLGVAVDPDFGENRFIYIYLSSSRGGATDNRIRRFVVNTDVTGVGEDRDILTGITWGTNGTHSGGRIRFGPDGNLWVTTGDTRSATVPQDRTVLGGKVLRVTRDGAPAPGNPPASGGSRPEIVFTGVRNPQGLAFRPGSGDVFICEHGPNVDDEVTRIVIGGNGGWNPDDGNGRYIGYEGALMSDPAIAGVVEPSFVLADSTGMSACDFAVGRAWGSWQGRLLVGLLAGQRTLAVTLDDEGTGVIGEPDALDGPGWRVRAVVMAPDGHVWVAFDSDAGEVWRVRPR
jgi:glucose/arabinose dehydrogenase